MHLNIFNEKRKMPGTDQEVFIVNHVHQRFTVLEYTVCLDLFYREREIKKKEYNI